MKVSRTYVLENASEFDRLEYQSTLPEYDFRKELTEFSIPIGGTCLDAGCGSGVVSKYLSEQFPDSQITGCDASADRIEQAKQSSSDYPNLKFQVSNLLNLAFPDHSFDSIVCRYVLQHIPPSQALQVVSELVRCLKPDGNLTLIDADGIFFNLHPLSPELQSTLLKIETDCSLDFHSGRKIPFLMSQSGLKDIEINIKAIPFISSSLDREYKLMETRLNLALPALISVLGSELAARRFSREYLNALRNPKSFYFHNMFIISGRK